MDCFAVAEMVRTKGVSAWTTVESLFRPFLHDFCETEKTVNWPAGALSNYLDGPCC